MYLLHIVYNKHDQPHSLLQSEGSHTNPSCSVRKCDLALLLTYIQIPVVVVGFCDKETKPRIFKISISHDFFHGISVLVVPISLSNYSLTSWTVQPDLVGLRTTT